MTASRIYIFIAVIVSFLLVTGIYTGLRISDWSHGNTLITTVVSVFIFFVILFQGLNIYFSFLKRGEHDIPLFHWISPLFFGAYICLLCFTIIIDLVGGISSFLPWSLSGEEKLYLDLGLTFIAIVGGFIQAMKDPKIYSVEVPLKNLPESFDGFKIVQISDMHVDHTTGERQTRRVVELVNPLKPDLIALTGDFADGFAHKLREDMAPLKELQAHFGKFFITGNHEYYWGVHEWIAEHQNLGAKPLLNEHVIISKGAEKIILAGVTDISSGRMLREHVSDPKKALMGAPQDLVKILLAHQPASYKEALQAGFDLQISGHTHGGQFFPGSIAVKLAQKFFKGLYRHESMWIYVSRGTGYWSIPLRFGVPKEITLITLKQV